MAIWVKGVNVITTNNSDWATNCPEYKVTALLEACRALLEEILRAVQCHNGRRTVLHPGCYHQNRRLQSIPQSLQGHGWIEVLGFGQRQGFAALAKELSSTVKRQHR